MVRDFRQPGPPGAGGPARHAVAATPNAGRTRRTVVLGIYLSAGLMALFGAGLLALGHGVIPPDTAKLVALVCFAVAVTDVLAVQFLKRMWRKRDGG